MGIGILESVNWGMGLSAIERSGDREVVLVGSWCFLVFLGGSLWFLVVFGGFK